MLPAPDLDERTFQHLVDEAKRYIQHRCPEWSDHNVSDPGVTLIETFAWMTDILLYRLNRVPEHVHAAFLDLLGVTRFPPAPARAEVDFRLSAPQTEPIVVPAGAEVATRRTVTDPAVPFTVVDELRILPATVAAVGSTIGERFAMVSDQLGTGRAVACFSDTPQPGDALYLGFNQAVPDHTVVASFVCELGGHGIDPDDPPLVWEAWDGSWAPCEVLRDETGGFNRTGRVELHVPRGHTEAVIDGHTLGWVRCRVVEHRRTYRSSPQLVEVRGATVGARAEVVHAVTHDLEVLGVSEGVAGQRYQLEHRPVLPDRDALVLHVQPDRPGGAGDAEGDAPVPEVWELRPDFADSTPDDHHFTLDPTTGTVRFGPVVRMADGTLRRHGAVPPKGSIIIVRRYRSGGGAVGNVGAGAITVLRSSVPLVATVSNPRSARGGVDGESVAEAKARGPLHLRTRNRAVTIEDFEVLAREAAPEIARVRAVLETSGPDAGAVRVLLVPAVHGADDQLGLADLDPDDETGRRVAAHLDERRLVGTRILVGPPGYLGIHLAANVTAAPRSDPERVRRQAVAALRAHFHPVLGGSAGTGWPFGRDVRLSEILGVLHRLSGIDVVEEATLELTHPLTGERLGARSVVELAPTNLVLVTGVAITVEAEGT
jgi:predicted phage baseplate assembly protein